MPFKLQPPRLWMHFLINVDLKLGSATEKRSQGDKWGGEQQQQTCATTCCDPETRSWKSLVTTQFVLFARNAFNQIQLQICVNYVNRTDPKSNNQIPPAPNIHWIYLPAVKNQLDWTLTDSLRLKQSKYFAFLCFFFKIHLTLNSPEVQSVCFWHAEVWILLRPSMKQHTVCLCVFLLPPVSERSKHNPKSLRLHRLKCVYRTENKANVTKCFSLGQTDEQSHAQPTASLDRCRKSTQLLFAAIQKNIKISTTILNVFIF